MHMNPLSINHIVPQMSNPLETSKDHGVFGMLSGQFLELTATLEAAVLLGRRLVLPDNWDCSALEAVGICGTLVETKVFFKMEMVDARNFYQPVQ